jgi:hypothetical protein
MHAGRNALAIIGAEPVVAAGYVQDRRIELLVKCFRERLAQPFQAGGRRKIFEGNYDHGSARGGRSVLSVKRRAQKHPEQQD